MSVADVWCLRIDQQSVNLSVIAPCSESTVTPAHCLHSLHTQPEWRHTAAHILAVISRRRLLVKCMYVESIRRTRLTMFIARTAFFYFVVMSSADFHSIECRSHLLCRSVPATRDQIPLEIHQPLVSHGHFHKQIKDTFLCYPCISFHK